ncbi:reticulon-1-A isoform X3 [Latimeria chalumnae]|uniref:reticulon-1-A isoform X3 n=1 Tax=Latimeria chalumnae TaxID=7897 RepID=UPI0006D8E10D|nr:PREDICTED: reticulon-1-A-like isoform X3 [Latimeria chalumnae]|eukprot:XP_006005573.2 PREDICTED: reticulon-1-A-like isoform X3 [Latimeria chalumnae]
MGSTVADLLYWKDTKTSGVVLTSIMLVLLSLSQFSVIIVSSYLALALLCITITLRVYKKALQALHKSDGANPFQSYLDIDVSLSQEQFQKYTEKILLYFTSLVSELRRLFLVQDLIDSIKFAVLMWLLTYIGAVFNGLTLLILAVVSAFSIPLLYRQHQAQIDQYVGLVSGHISNIRAKIQAKLPSAKPKTQ